MRRDFLAWLIPALLVAVLLALFSPGAFASALFASGLLLILTALGLYAAWHWGGGGRQLALLIALAFLLRLGIGLFFTLALPAWGYPEPSQQAGYLFPDAWRRDTEAFQVAMAGTPLLFNPQLQFSADQYGGLGLLSAAIYRFLSPDAHRPLLMLIPGALVFALGVPFLHRALQLCWDEKLAALAVWIYILYPEGLFFTASQMREPYLIGFSAVGLWAALSWSKNWRSALLAGLLSLAGMALISYRAALFIAGALGLLFWIEQVLGKRCGRLGWVGLAGGILAVAGLSWFWFREVSGWDMLVTIRQSGMLANVIDKLPDILHAPFVIAYGLLQPVLPATIADPAIPLWHVVAILRAAGWYTLLPLLVYAAFSVWRTADLSERRRMIWAVLLAALWVVIASARAGGDLTDNPRYRTIFLVWLALLAAWAVQRAIKIRDPWLIRWLLVEGVFLGFFTQWYLVRYSGNGPKLPFFVMVALIAGLSGAILIGGWGWDLYRKKFNHGN
jgi:hypothetical protein